MRWFNGDSVRYGAALFVTASVLGACSTDSAPAPGPAPDTVPGPEVVAQTVGPAGGQVEVGGIVLDIPAGALSDSVVITIAATGATTVVEDETGLDFVTPVYTLGPEGTTFAEPITITIDYASDESDPASVYWTLAGDPTKFRELRHVANDGQTLTFEIDHFSKGGAAIRKRKTPGPVSTGRAYVNGSQDVSGDGSSWSEAYKTLQEALEVVPEGWDVWVASGTYRTGASIDQAFELRPNIHVFGGFRGAEMTVAERNIAANPTILSGDVDGNDDGSPASLADNSGSVVVLQDGSGVDGVTIQDGVGFHGGALLAVGAGTTLANSLLRGNAAQFLGGAVFVYPFGTSLTVENSLIDNNTGNEGGGLFSHIQANLVLSDTVVSNNTAVVKCGGGLRAFWQGSVTTRNVVFSGNVAGDCGGVPKQG